MNTVVNYSTDKRINDLATTLSKEISDVYDTFGKNSPITKRYLSSLAQMDGANKDILLQKFGTKLDGIKSELEKEKKPLEEEKAQLQKESKFLESSSEQHLSYLNNQWQALNQASQILKQNSAAIKAGPAPLSLKEIQKKLQAEGGEVLQLIPSKRSLWKGETHLWRVYKLIGAMIKFL